MGAYTRVGCAKGVEGGREAEGCEERAIELAVVAQVELSRAYRDPGVDCRHRVPQRPVFQAEKQVRQHGGRDQSQHERHLPYFLEIAGIRSFQVNRPQSKKKKKKKKKKKRPVVTT